MKTVTMCNYYYYYLLATCTTLYTLPSTFYFYPHTLLFYLVLVLQVVLRVPQRTTCATPCQLHHHRFSFSCWTTWCFWRRVNTDEMFTCRGYLFTPSFQQFLALGWFLGIHWTGKRVHCFPHKPIQTRSGQPRLCVDLSRTVWQLFKMFPGNFKLQVKERKSYD